MIVGQRSSPKRLDEPDHFLDAYARNRTYRDGDPGAAQALVELNQIKCITFMGPEPWGLFSTAGAKLHSTPAILAESAPRSSLD